MNEERWRKYQLQIAELRASLLDVLSLVNASNDPVPAQHSILVSEVEQLRRAARRVEHRDHIIRRARAVIDGTKDEASS